MSRIRRHGLATRSIHLGVGCSKPNHTPDLISLLLACSSRSEPSVCVLPPWDHKHKQALSSLACLRHGV